MMQHTLRPLYRQRGAALIIGLIFLVILTLVGVTAMQTTTLEEHIAGNNRDRNVAFQAAEVVLRDGERDIVCSNAAGTGACTRTVPISGLSGFDNNCTSGLCYSGRTDGLFRASASDPWKPAWQAFSMTVAPSVPYGNYTKAVAINSLASPPRYLIEGFRKWPPGSSSWRYYYRITALAVGANNNTQVNLQEVFVP